MFHVEEVMGTAVTIDIADPLPHGTLTGLVERTCAWLHEVDERFSTYKPASEVNRLDRGELPAGGCSPDMKEVLDACAELRRATGGYFDAWATGRLDPSGYVKGWSVEVASARLAAAGSLNHCVNAGGDVRTRGRPEPGRPWRIGVRHPWEPGEQAWVLSATDLAVATSGTYERGDHVIDPHSGEPATTLRSVTVTGPDLAVADAYATAAQAMGLDGLLWLARLADSGYESAAVTGDGHAYRSEGFPTV
ncbi:FAD:protein FMN transferase [Spirillospora albida]|uniref:FAD:protein FMN transferase n=1 Tax=Spirillospora albida TaxID=58123 RepID=UPI000A68E448|nr:FAD:protein FMN transferase [Spirillospora albida]